MKPKPGAEFGGEPFTLGTRVRFWLIRRLAGRRGVMLNMRVVEGSVTVEATDPPTIIENCLFIGPLDGSAVRLR